MRYKETLIDLSILLLICGLFFYQWIVHDFTGLIQTDNELGIAWHQYAIISFNKGEFPYWDPYNYYTFFTTATWLFYPPNLILYTVSSFITLSIDTLYMIYIILLMAHFYLASVTMYFFLRHLEIERVSSALGAIIYTYNLYSLIMGGVFQTYIRLIHYAYIPLIFILLLKFLKATKYKIELAIGAGVSMGIIILGGQIQPLVYYFPLMFVLIVWHITCIQRKEKWFLEAAKNTLLLCLMFLIAFGLSAIMTIPTLYQVDYLNRSVKDYQNIIGLSMSPFYFIVASIYPPFDHNPQLTNFVGGGYWEVVIFFGTTSIILAFFGLFSKHKYLSYFIIVLIYSVFIIMGKFIFTGYIQYDLTQYLLRYPARANIMFIFVISYFAAIGLEYIGKILDEEDRNTK